MVMKTQLSSNKNQEIENQVAHILLEFEVIVMMYSKEY